MFHGKTSTSTTQGEDYYYDLLPVQYTEFSPQLRKFLIYMPCLASQNSAIIGRINICRLRLGQTLRFHSVTKIAHGPNAAISILQTAKISRPNQDRREKVGDSYFQQNVKKFCNLENRHSADPVQFLPDPDPDPTFVDMPFKQTKSLCHFLT